jgi:hypothetical protein
MMRVYIIISIIISGCRDKKKSESDSLPPDTSDLSKTNPLKPVCELPPKPPGPIPTPPRDEEALKWVQSFRDTALGGTSTNSLRWFTGANLQIGPSPIKTKGEYDLLVRDVAEHFALSEMQSSTKVNGGSQTISRLKIHVKEKSETCVYIVTVSHVDNKMLEATAKAIVNTGVWASTASETTGAKTAIGSKTAEQAISDWYTNTLTDRFVLGMSAVRATITGKGIEYSPEVVFTIKS